MVGVILTSQQATVLNTLVDTPTATINALESETGLDQSELIDDLDYLLLQQVVEQDEASYRLAERIRRKLG